MVPGCLIGPGLVQLLPERQAERSGWNASQHFNIYEELGLGKTIVSKSSLQTINMGPSTKRNKKMIINKDGRTESPLIGFRAKLTISQQECIPNQAYHC